MATTKREQYRQAAERVGTAKRELAEALAIVRTSDLTLAARLERLIASVDRLEYRFNRRVARG